MGGPNTIDLAVERGGRVSLRASGLEPADPYGRASLRSPSAPLVRRRGRRSRLQGALVGSGFLHLVVLAMLLVVIKPTGTAPTSEPPSVEMVFGHNGSAGLRGASVPQTEQGSAPPPVAAPAPEPLQPPPSPATPAAPPTPRVVPRASTPSETTIRQRQATAPAREQPRREIRRERRSANPFAHLTNLSLAPMQVPATPDVARRGRGGSGRAVNLSIGPLVQGGRLAMPFSMRGGHGMTSDYQDMIDDWVNRHKYYPQPAADRGHDGQVAIHVTWDRNGRVLGVRLIYGSGDEDLDDAWLGLFRGATLPPPPPDVQGDPIEYDMIMNYELLR